MLAAVSAAGCDRRERSVAVDSLLSRDLTLAGAVTTTGAPSPLGDTAASLPEDQSLLPAPDRAGRPSPPPTAARAPKPAPSRPAAASAPVASPSPAMATDHTPAAPAATAPAADVSSSDRSAGAGSAPVPSEGPKSSTNNTVGRSAVGVGGTLAGKTNAQICSLANRPGDRLVASLAADVTASDGSKLPAGTPILIEMASPATPESFAFRVKAVQVGGTLVPVEGTVVVEGASTERRVSKGGDQGKVITGAIAGAILGRVLGGGTKGTVIGAAGGAAAGTVAAARNSVTERCLPAGATVTVTLSAPLVLSPGVP